MKREKNSKVTLTVFVLAAVFALGALAGVTAPVVKGFIGPNVKTDFNETVERPSIKPSAHIHPMASVIGNVEIGERVMIAPFASIRGDEGQPIHIGNESNAQEGVVLHALETEVEGKEVPNRLIEVNGKKYAVYIGEKVSLAHQSQVHGPAYVGDGSFVAMQALVFNAKVGKGCVLEPASVVVGVQIPDGRYVKTGQVVTDQAEADKLPAVTDDYKYAKTNAGVVHVNTSLADGYNGKTPLKEHKSH